MEINESIITDRKKILFLALSLFFCSQSRKDMPFDEFSAIKFSFLQSRSLLLILCFEIIIPLEIKATISKMPGENNIFYFFRG
jgi:hypothetical protein